jgi:hypothetical protein
MEYSSLTAKLIKIIEIKGVYALKNGCERAKWLGWKG